MAKLLSLSIYCILIIWLIYFLVMLNVFCVCVFFKIKINFQQIVNNADTLGLVFSTVYIG